MLNKSSDKAEALSWLQQQDSKERTIGESSEDMNAADSLRFVQQLYHRGAVEVIAIDIDFDLHLETTSTLIVELPEDALSRKQVLEMEAGIAQEHGFDAVEPTRDRNIF